jgi:hypothetical protein
LQNRRCIRCNRSERAIDASGAIIWAPPAYRRASVVSASATTDAGARIELCCNQCGNQFGEGDDSAGRQSTFTAGSTAVPRFGVGLDNETPAERAFQMELGGFEPPTSWVRFPTDRFPRVAMLRRLALLSEKCECAFIVLRHGWSKEFDHDLTTP